MLKEDYAKVCVKTESERKPFLFLDKQKREGVGHQPCTGEMLKKALQGAEMWYQMNETTDLPQGLKSIRNGKYVNKYNQFIFLI